MKVKLLIGIATIFYFTNLTGFVIADDIQITSQSETGSGMIEYGLPPSPEIIFYPTDIAIDFGGVSGPVIEGGNHSSPIITETEQVEGPEHTGGVIETSCSPVPEPATIFLFGVGITSIAFVSKKK